ncbi:WD40 repeat domain-containing protein [Chloropicon primus]|uniref:WD40 repeat domain-containing protein n=2 Tax=Chloropicon primus TaxID=1764295 RepID=A0A5B8MJ88_9CHLO|nr:WD40 repeat domain-containing protein [Chloropicon primus]|eukprot:QDZ20688.1 WD40 repeat domain-containing protein [Chloropicon primus]
MMSSEQQGSQRGLGSSLRRLKATSRDRRTSRKKGPPVNSAAASHELNDKYMDAMEEAFQSMSSKENIDFQEPRTKEGEVRGSSNKGPVLHQGHQPLKTALGSKAGGARAVARTAETEAPPKGQLPGAWCSGPKDRSGTKIDLSDRPSLCMDVRNDCAVIGSSDHALYEVNFRKGKRTRKLYSKAYGHCEWVNAVKYFPDGKVLSAGLDSKLLLWHSSAVRATELKGHSHSVSGIQVSPDGGVACSCSYDKTVKFWDISGLNGRESQSLRGHKAPVMEMAWRDHTLVSGSRDGALILWDVLKGKPKKAVGAAHQGHITALALFDGRDDNLVLSGGQDGCLQVRDQRLQDCLFEKYHHRRDGGAGAIGAIRCTADGNVVTMGADKRICISDPRMSFEKVGAISSNKDFIYSMELMGDLVISGSGDGQVLVHDMRTGSCLYGLEGNQNAVRSLGVTDDFLVASGDDGNVISYPMA